MRHSDEIMTKPSPFQKTSAILLCSYWVALFAATHIPGSAMPNTGGLSDKLLHVIAYGILTFLLLLFLNSKIAIKRATWPWTYLRALLVVVAYAVADELLQIPIPGRYAEFRDWIADLLGILSGLTIWSLLRWALGHISSWASGGDSVRD